MWISKKKWHELEERLSGLEKQVQSRTERSETPNEKIKINPRDTFQQECLDLAMKYHCPLKNVKDNYDILSQQDRCGGVELGSR